MAPRSSIESGLDLVLVLLYARGSARELCEDVSDSTRLVKLVYLLVREGGFGHLGGDLRFEARDYGPWSADVFDAVETLCGMGLVEAQRMVPERFDEVADQVELAGGAADHDGAGEAPAEARAKTTYYLSKKGRKVAKVLYGGAGRSEIARIEFVKGRFSKLELHDVLRYVCSRYPEHTIKSRMRAKMAGRRGGRDA